MTQLDRPDLSWFDDPDEFDADPRTSAFPPDGLITVRYLWDAVRRHSLIWLSTALAGLLVGIAAVLLIPGSSEASSKILLVHREGDDPERAIVTDNSLAETNTVASRVIDELGLSMTPEEVLDSYTVTALTDRVLEINARAATDGEAIDLAAMVGEVFLEFRTEQAEQQIEPLRHALEDARNDVNAARKNVIDAGGDPDDSDPEPSPEQRTLTRAVERRQFIDQQILDQEAVTGRMNSSRILDKAALVPQSQLRSVAMAAGSGLAGGLFLGLAFVVARALISDRLWRRHDIALALGAPIGMSVGAPRRRFGARRLLTRSARLNPAVRRVLPYLRAQVAWDAAKPTLALVNIGDVKDSVLIATAVAESFASDGSRVLVVDMTDDQAMRRAADLPNRPGVHRFELEGSVAIVRVYVPETLDQPGLSPGSLPSSDDFQDEWSEADLVVVLATVSPATGAEHLTPWASEVVALVGAGQASATEIAATGEVLRVAAVQLRTALLVRTDKSDLSIGGVDP